MKHLHMLLALVALLMFIYQAAPIFRGQARRLPKAAMGASHVVYLLLVATGIYMTYLLNAAGAGLQHWAVAKLVLLVVAASATIKANRQAADNISQAKAGVLIGAVAYAGIVFLAFAKPVLL